MSTHPYDKQFVDSLIALAFEENSPDIIIQIRNKAIQYIASSVDGGESSIVSEGFQGKNVTFQVNKSASQLFTECTEALRQYNNGTVTTTQTSWWGYWDIY